MYELTPYLGLSYLYEFRLQKSLQQMPMKQQFCSEHCTSRSSQNKSVLLVIFKTIRHLAVL